MHSRKNLTGSGCLFLMENSNSFLSSFGSAKSVSQAVSHQKGNAISFTVPHDAVPTDRFTRKRSRKTCELKRWRGRNGPCGFRDTCKQRCPFGAGEQIESRSHSTNRAEAGSGCATGGKTILKCSGQITDAGSTVKRKYVKPDLARRACAGHQKLPSPAVNDCVASSFSDDDGCLPRPNFIHSQGSYNISTSPACCSCRTGVRKTYASGDSFHFQRTAITRVPFPGADSISKSFTRRLLPPRPNPMPPPVVKPS